MRRIIIVPISVIALLLFALVFRVSVAVPVDATLTPYAYLPHIEKDEPASLLLTATPTSRPSPSFISVKVGELSGHSNPEYVDIYNRGTEAQELTGWTILSVIGQETYTFPTEYILPAGDLVQIETGSRAVHNPPLQLLWQNQPVWNDSGDRVILYDSDHEKVSSACYGIGCAPP